MFAIYLFLLIVGAGLAILSFAGDAFGGGELDAGGFGDLGGAEELGDFGGWWEAFSILALVYAAFGAGATGTLLHLLWDGERVLLTALLAGGSGLVCGTVANVLLAYLRRSGSGETLSESSFEGLPADVTLPLGAGTAGRIRVRRGQREHVLRALPYPSDPASLEGDAERWRRVVVVEVRDGVAYVTPAGPELEALGS